MFVRNAFGSLVCHAGWVRQRFGQNQSEQNPSTEPRICRGNFHHPCFGIGHPLGVRRSQQKQRGDAGPIHRPRHRSHPSSRRK